MSPRTSLDTQEFENSTITLLARTPGILTERQLEIWILTFREGLTAFALSKHTGIPLRTVQRELERAKLKLRESLLDGPHKERFKIILVSGSEVWEATDTTLKAASDREERREWRQGKLRMGAMDASGSLKAA